MSRSSSRRRPSWSIPRCGCLDSRELVDGDADGVDVAGMVVRHRALRSWYSWGAGGIKGDAPCGLELDSLSCPASDA
jgi:hypothetical protein